MNANPKTMARQIRAARVAADARVVSGSRLAYSSNTGDSSAQEREARAVARQEAREAACPQHIMHEITLEWHNFVEGTCKCGKHMFYSE